MSEITPDATILEDGDDVLLGDSTEADGTEFASVDVLGKHAEDETDVTKVPAKKEAVVKKEVAAVEDDIPEEFKGKSVKEVVKMYQDAHKVIGRQGSELGELRAKADHAIKLSLEAIRAGRSKPDAPAKEEVPQTLDESELFSKPTEFLNKVLANSPVIKEIRDSLGQAAAAQASTRAAAATTRFNTAHPDAGEILRDPEFRQWVNASPVRTELLRRAHNQFDFASGDEVFSTWKALRGVKQATSKEGEQSGKTTTPAAKADNTVSEAGKTLAAARQAKKEAQARAAGVPTSGAAGASAGKGSKPLFRRVDVMRLMVEDPDRYEALSDEISLAYAEGRVR
jgi:hypothetical protein